MDNNSAKLLGLKGVIVKNVESNEKELHINIELPRRMHKCPVCKAKTNRVHDYRNQVIRDSKAFGKPSYAKLLAYFQEISVEDLTKRPTVIVSSAMEEFYRDLASEYGIDIDTVTKIGDAVITKYVLGKHYCSNIRTTYAGSSPRW